MPTRWRDGIVEERTVEYVGHISATYGQKETVVVGRKTIQTWCKDPGIGSAVIKRMVESGLAEPFDENEAKPSAYKLYVAKMKKFFKESQKGSE